MSVLTPAKKPRGQTWITLSQWPFIISRPHSVRNSCFRPWKPLIIPLLPPPTTNAPRLKKHRSSLNNFPLNSLDRSSQEFWTQRCLYTGKKNINNLTTCMQHQKIFQIQQQSSCCMSPVLKDKFPLKCNSLFIYSTSLVLFRRCKFRGAQMISGASLQTSIALS